jgi:hypothetical protein
MNVDPRDIEVMDADMAELLRRTPGVQRVQSVFDMHEFSREMLLKSLRSRHPEWSEEQVRAEAIRRLFGVTI